MSAKVAARDEDVPAPLDDDILDSENGLNTEPYGHDTDKPAHPHITYLHKFIHEDPVHRPYRIAAIVCTGIALLTSIGSIITSGVMWERAYTYKGTDTDRVLYASLYIFTLAESTLSFIAMLVDFSELFFRPSNIIIRDRGDSKFVGRCITVFLLLLCAIYSFVVPIVLKNREPKVSAALCVIPGVRFVALIIFFAVLIVDSKQ